MRKFIIALMAALSVATTNGLCQLENWEVVSPLKTNTTLSGSYAELRRNHFHGGLDFRTLNGENTPIYAIDKGYVSRITISARSYGKLAYITHANGCMSLYAHLNGFVPKLDSIVKAKQYAKQSYEIDFTLEPNEYPVTKGELFALSGNTGASAGPHLHFEIRTVEDQYMLNPLKLNKYFHFEDNKNPRIFAVKLYGLNGGSINGLTEKRFNSAMVKGQGRRLQASGNIKAWGEIGFGVKANDYMTGTHFTHTPRHLKIYADDKIISNITLENYKFSDTRALNNIIDYKHQQNTGEFFIRSFHDKNNPLDIYHGTTGILTVNEERDYNMKYVVIDDFGNSDSISFTIRGERKELLLPIKREGDMITAGEGTFYDKGDFLFHFPANALYSDLYTDYKKKPSARYYSSIHSIGKKDVPLHTYCDISIKLEKDPSTIDVSKLFIAKLNENDLISGSAGGKYTDGFLIGATNALGKFAIAEDKTPPVISAVHTKGLRNYPVLVFRIGDGLSGIANIDGYIDDQWVLFEHDAKTHTIRYAIDTKKFEKGKSHAFKLIVTDYCGNKAIYSRVIFL